MEERMSIQEKHLIISIIGTFLSYGIFYFYALRWYDDGTMSMMEEMRFWAKGLLWLIPIQIGFKVIPFILFHIIHYIATKEKADHMDDEFGKKIESRGNRNFYYVFQAGFYGAMIAIVYEAPIFWIFNIFILFGFLGTLFMDFSQLYFYRKGIR